MSPNVVCGAATPGIVDLGVGVDQVLHHHHRVVALLERLAVEETRQLRERLRVVVDGDATYCWCAANSCAICSLSRLTKVSAGMGGDASYLLALDGAAQAREAEETLLQVAAALQEVPRRCKRLEKAGHAGGRNGHYVVELGIGKKTLKAARAPLAPVSCAPHGHLPRHGWCGIPRIASLR